MGPGVGVLGTNTPEKNKDSTSRNKQSSRSRIVNELEQIDFSEINHDQPVDSIAHEGFLDRFNSMVKNQDFLIQRMDEFLRELKRSEAEIYINKK